MDEKRVQQMVTMLFYLNPNYLKIENGMIVMQDKIFEKDNEEEPKNEEIEIDEEMSRSTNTEEDEKSQKKESFMESEKEGDVQILEDKGNESEENDQKTETKAQETQKEIKDEKLMPTNKKRKIESETIMVTDLEVNIGRLFEEEMLNDAIINTFAEIILEEEKNTQIEYITSWKFSTMSKNLQVKKGKGKTRVIAAINEPAKNEEEVGHWYALAADLNLGQIFIFDSIRKNNSYYEANIGIMKKYLKTNLTLSCNDRWWASIPQQTDSFNCGAFLCYFIYCFLKKIQINKGIAIQDFKKGIYNTIKRRWK